MEEKIKTLSELSEIVGKLKKQGKKIVLSHGCFDYLHYGHIEHFLDAKKQGDILIVTITPDRFIQKGPGRPFFNEQYRMKHIAFLDFVDYVALNEWDTAIETIKIIQPDIYAKGKEVLGNKNIDELKIKGEKKSNLQAEVDVLESFGGKLYLTDQITFSSSKLINTFTDNFSEELKDFLKEVKKKANAEDIIKILESLKDLKVLIIGEGILDEYIFCEQLGRSGKEPIIAYKNLSSETYAGGAFAIANQVAQFTNNISILTCIGNNYEFIDSNLDKNIERNIFIQKDLKTLVKTHYIDKYKMLKLFEIYNNDEFDVNQETESRIIKYIEQNSSRFDIIILADYGHGLFTPNLIEQISKTNKFLAINTQINAGNMGYNFITKYPRADYVSLTEKEIRLPFSEKKSDIKVSINKLSNHFNLNKINITRGKNGSIYFYCGENYVCPAFIKEPLDTMGSADKILSLTSMLAYKNIDPYIFSMLNNTIGGLAVRIVGNRSVVSFGEIKKFIHYILK